MFLLHVDDLFDDTSHLSLRLLTKFFERFLDDLVEIDRNLKFGVVGNAIVEE